MKICPHCGQRIRQSPDQAILSGLDYTSGISKGTGSPIPASLYAAAMPTDTRRADFNRWFMTGPPEREGYVRGPFPPEQIERLVRSGAIAPDFVDEQGVQSYVLAKFRGRRG